MSIKKYSGGGAAAALLIASATGLGSIGAHAENFDSPAPISVISAEDISRQGIVDVGDIANMVPSLIVDPGANPGTNRITIRGLRPSPFQENVGVYVDGIDISSQSLTAPGGSILSNPHFWGDIQRIEVLKGPQSSLFGRNASAGVINITTSRPGDEVGGHAGFDVGNEGRYSAYGGVSGPVSGGLSLGLNGGYWSKEGFYKNQIDDKEVGGGDGWGIGIDGSWKVNDNLSVSGRLSYSSDEYDQQAQAIVPAYASIDVPADALISAAVRCEPQLAAAIVALGRNPGPGGDVFCDTPVAAFVGTIPNAENLDVRLSPDFLNGGALPGSERDVFRLSFAADWNIELGTISSVTGYTDADTSTFIDRDKFALPGAAFGEDLSAILQILDTGTWTTQISQDLRFTSDLDGPLQFSIGGLYWNEKVKQDDQNHTILAAGALCILPTFIFDACPAFTSDPAGQFVSAVHAAKPVHRTERSTRHYSFFGSIEFDFTDQFKLIADGRYIDERVRLTGPATLPGGGQQDPFFQGPGFTNVCGFGDCSDPMALDFSLLPTMQESFERSDTYFAYGTRLEWSPTEEATLYVSYSVEKTPGGFATTPFTGLDLGVDPDHNGSASELEFGPERIRTIEVGARAAALNDTVNFNAAFFYQDIADKQVVTQSLGADLGGAPVLVGSISNSADAEIYGIELSGDWKPTDNFNLTASYTWLESEYDNFMAYSTSASEIAAAGNCMPATLGGLPTCWVDRSGNDLEGVPNHSFFGASTYSQPLTGDINWFFQARGRFQGERFVDSSNSAMLDGYWLSDLRLGVTNDRWQFLLYVDNVLNNDTVRSAFTQADIANGEYRVGVCAIVPLCTAFAPVVDPNVPVATVANLPDPRTWGVRARFKF